jgi:hypothetical protein
MKKTFTTKVVILLVAVVAIGHTHTLQAQDSTSVSANKVTLDINADLVSRYIWRGLPVSLTPNIQPYATLGYKNFAAQFWGSYGIAEPYAEVDFNISYTLGAFTLSVWDYYNEDESDLANNDYFDWSDTTAHSLEGSVIFHGTESFPLSITLATYFYGNDKDENNKNYYSSYLELGYERSIGETNVKVFAGGTFSQGYYANKAGLVNVGFTASRALKLTEKTSLPVMGSLIINPNVRNVFFVFGITF